MRKFLKLVEENRPGEDKYTVELRDVNGELIDSFLMVGTGSPFENFDRFKEEWGSPVPIEDNEFLQAQAADDPAGPAAAALEDRQATADAIIAAFIADTEQMKQAADGSGGAAVAPAGGGSFGSSQ